MPKTRTLGARTHGIDGWVPPMGRVLSEFQWPREDPCHCLVGRRSAEAFSVSLSLQWGYAHRASAAESGKTKHEVTESNAMAFAVL